jgi:2,3-bisphosphoglycerate-independent phosphoglycerate mutase
MPNVSVAFDAMDLSNTLGEYISNLGLKQLRIAETEKFAHVTFFFNGGREAPYLGEDRLLVPSLKVATYDLKPEMSAGEVTDRLIERINSKEYDLIVINYANPDMVGHTGVFDAAVSAVEYVDKCVGKVMDAVLSTGAQMFLCADHGNSDKMIDFEANEPFTAHSTNPVPFVIVNCNVAKGIAEGGKLCDIAPTLLDMMGIEKPKEMTGKSLLLKD